MLEVPRSSFYEWRRRATGETATAARRRVLAGHVERVFKQQRGTAGCRRVATQLNGEGHRYSVGLIADLIGHGFDPDDAASSGNTVRQRINRGGDRRLNRALHMAVVTRMRMDPDTRAYVGKRTAEGRTLREIRRSLKRYLARQIYRHLNAVTAVAATA